MNNQKIPIVAVLGHVDHGKSSLLDAIRNSDIVENEVGEITNQSGNYKEGRDAQKIIDSSRKIFAESIGIKSESFFFMSCVSDGVFLTIKEAIKQATERNIKKPNIVFGPLEHTSILKISDNLQKQGVDITFLDTDEFGKIKLDNLKEKIKTETILVCIQSVNGDTGIKNNIHKLANEIKNINNEVLFISDITQDIPYTQYNLHSFAIDVAVFNCSKFCGPAAVAGLAFKETQVASKFTKNAIKRLSLSSNVSVPLIFGSATAYKDMIKTRKRTTKKLRKLQLFLIKKLKEILPEWKIYGINAKINTISSIEDKKLLRLSPHILTLYKNNMDLDYHIAFLDENNFSVSKGTSCRVLGEGVLKKIAKNSNYHSKSLGSGIRIGLLSNHKKKDIKKLLTLIKKADNIQSR